MSRKKQTVSIIIANYNGEKYLSKCLKSVLASDYKNYELILVDDGSDDDSITIIKKYCAIDKRINLIENERNIGAAASRNKAVRYASGDLLIFLDNDTEVDKFWLNQMIKVLRSNERVGACQAKLLDFKMRNKFQNIGVKLWAATAWGLPIGQWEIDKGQYDFEDDIVGISAALAVKKKIFEKIDGFDEMEAVVTEDLDFCWRIWIAGYRVVRAPKAVVYHWTKSVNMRENMKHNEEVIYFHLTKNSLISISKNYELNNAIYYFFYSLTISFARSFIVLIKRHKLSALAGTLKGVVWVFLYFPSILHKRSLINRNRVYNDKQLFDIILMRKSLLYIYNNYYIHTKLI